MTSSKTDNAKTSPTKSRETPKKPRGSPFIESDTDDGVVDHKARRQSLLSDRKRSPLAKFDGIKRDRTEASHSPIAKTRVTPKKPRRSPFIDSDTDDEVVDHRARRQDIVYNRNPSPLAKFNGIKRERTEASHSPVIRKISLQTYSQREKDKAPEVKDLEDRLKRQKSLRDQAEAKAKGADAVIKDLQDRMKVQSSLKKQDDARIKQLEKEVKSLTELLALERSMRNLDKTKIKQLERDLKMANSNVRRLMKNNDHLTKVLSMLKARLQKALNSSNETTIALEVALSKFGNSDTDQTEADDNHSATLQDNGIVTRDDVFRTIQRYEKQLLRKTTETKARESSLLDLIANMEDAIPSETRHNYNIPLTEGTLFLEQERQWATVAGKNEGSARLICESCIKGYYHCSAEQMCSRCKHDGGRCVYALCSAEQAKKSCEDESCHQFHKSYAQHGSRGYWTLSEKGDIKKA